MNTEPSRQSSRIPRAGWRLCLLASMIGLASAQDPAALVKLRDEYRAKCEEAKKDYTAALRTLRDTMEVEVREKEAVTAAEQAKKNEPLPLGLVRPVTGDPPKDIGAPPEIRLRKFGKPSPRIATLGPDAVVASVDLPLGTLGVAVDYSSDLAESPDLLRFDFTGEGNFTADHAISFDPQGYGRFGPKVLEVTRDGKTIPVNVSGVLRHSPDSPLMELSVGSVVEATCSFGDKIHRVRLADGRGRLDFVRGIAALEQGRRRMTGSGLLIDPAGDGSFSVKGEYGQPIRVGDKWYDITLDGQTMSARPLDLDSAAITFPKGTLTCSLAGKEFACYFTSRAPIDAIPAGDFAILEYYLNSSSLFRGDFRLAPGESGWLSAQGPVDENGTPKLMSFPPDKVTDIPIGEPLTARVAAKRNAEGILLSLDVTDRGGGRINQMRLPGQFGREGRSLGDFRPAAPKVKVMDANGKTVYEALLRYPSGAGESIACSKLWQPPAELKGRFTITVEFSARPFKTRLESTELLLE